MAQQQLWRAEDSKFCPLLLEVVKGVDDEVDIILLGFLTIFEILISLNQLTIEGRLCRTQTG